MLSENFQALQNKSFRWLFLAQAINLLGDAISWTGLALLAHQIANDGATSVLSISLTIRVLVFVFVAPYTGVLADRADRKKLMLWSHGIRMILISILPFAFYEWHIYVFVFLFSILHALFTPTYKATVPLLFEDKELYPQAISLSSATYQLLGILGPGIAGGITLFFSLKVIFWADALTFLLSGICILLIPASLKVKSEVPIRGGFFEELRTGTRLLFGNHFMKRALFMQLVVSVVGAQILVNTIFHVKETLALDDSHYGWVMSVMGLGAVIGSVSAGRLKTQKARLLSTVYGAVSACIFMALANEYTFVGTLIFWAIIGACQSLVNIPTDTLIADNTEKSLQGRVYGAHFAWSHLWWVISYPIAGLSNHYFAADFFFIGSLIGLAFWAIFVFFNRGPSRLI